MSVSLKIEVGVNAPFAGYGRPPWAWNSRPAARKRPQKSPPGRAQKSRALNTENPAQNVRGYPAWDEKGVVRKSPNE